MCVATGSSRVEYVSYLPLIKKKRVCELLNNKKMVTTHHYVSCALYIGVGSATNYLDGLI
jgi:hypothetical protein